MKYRFLQIKVVKLLLGCAVFGVCFSSFAAIARAQTTTFAQFLQIPANQDFVFTNNTTSGTFSTVGGGSSILFVYSSIAGLHPELQGGQNARIFITPTTTTIPATLSTGNLTQPLNQTITISIIRNTPTSPGVGTGTRTNLLTAVITPNTNNPLLGGADGSNSATFSASTSPTSMDNNVTFTSDFLNFSATTARNLGLSFSSVTPNLSLGAGSFLNSFTAAGTGTFASNPVPTPVGPTAADVTISGRVLTPNGRGLRNAMVTVTEADGSTRTVLTGNAGSFSFPELTIPQTVVVSVRSKSYRFIPRVISLDSDLADLDFTGLGK
jgi:hypothetical protein